MKYNVVVAILRGYYCNIAILLDLADRTVTMLQKHHASVYVYNASSCGHTTMPDPTLRDK